MNLIPTIVLALEGQVLQFTSDMIRGSGISVPVRVHGVGVCSSCSQMLIRNIILIEPVPALNCSVILLEADLAAIPIIGVSVVGASTRILLTMPCRVAATL